MNGSVTSIGFDINPMAKSTRTSTYRATVLDANQCSHARRVRSQNRVLSTSFRSAIQATDSTCSGWTADSAATNAGRQTAPVIRTRSRKSSRTFTACSRRLVRWCRPASSPNNRTSSKWDSHVTGCQFAASKVPNAQAAVSVLRPLRTCALAVT